jgi:hypothetical protein
MSKPSYLPSLLTQDCLEALLRLPAGCHVLDRVLIRLGAASRHGWRGSLRQLCFAYRELTGKGICHKTAKRHVDALVGCGRLSVTDGSWLTYRLRVAQGAGATPTGCGSHARTIRAPRPQGVGELRPHDTGATPAHCGSHAHTLIEEKREEGVPPSSLDRRTEFENALALLLPPGAAPRGEGGRRRVTAGSIFKEQQNDLARGLAEVTAVSSPADGDHNDVDQVAPPAERRSAAAGKDDDDGGRGA